MLRTKESRINAYVAVVVGSGLLAVLLSARLDPTLPDPSRVSALGALAFVVVAVVLDVSERRLAVGAAGTLAFLAYIAAALVLGPTLGGVVAGLSVVASHALNRKPLVKTLFNASQHVLSIVAGTAAYLALGGPVPPSPLEAVLLPFVGLVVVYFTINSSLVSGVVALSEEQRFSDVWIANTWSLAGYDVVASALGLAVAWLYDRSGVLSVAIVFLPIAFLRHTYLVNLQLQATNRELLDLMVKAIEARDPYTSGHSQRVSEIARWIAREMGLHFREVEQIATAALLHDVGKIYEEFAPILRKEGRLSREERQIMDSHPVRSAELVGTISNLRGYVHKCVRHHHENFDGSGYPDGLVGDGIPIGARIILVADTTDAMMTERPYRKALTYERVLEELEKHAGRQFDPQVVAAFKRSATVRRLVGPSRQPQAMPTSPAAERREQLAAR